MLILKADNDLNEPNHPFKQKIGIEPDPFNTQSNGVFIWLPGHKGRKWVHVESIYTL